MDERYIYQTKKTGVTLVAIPISIGSMGLVYYLATLGWFLWYTSRQIYRFVPWIRHGLASLGLATLRCGYSPNGGAERWWWIPWDPNPWKKHQLNKSKIMESRRTFKKNCLVTKGPVFWTPMTQIFTFFFPHCSMLKAWVKDIGYSPSQLLGVLSISWTYLIGVNNPRKTHL